MKAIFNRFQAIATVIQLLLFCFVQGTFGQTNVPVVKLNKYQFQCNECVEFAINYNRDFYNPYDPDEADVSIQILKPDGKTVTIPAFYFQEFEFKNISHSGKSVEWLYPVGLPYWKVRYTPNIEGEYKATTVVKIRNNEIVKSLPISFLCKGKTGIGFIRISTTNPNYLEFENKEPFFPIGLNLAFVGFGQYLSLSKISEVFSKMAENGANYARIWFCCEDWAIAIESRKSAFGRSYNWNPPIVLPPGNESYHSGELAVQIGGEKTDSIQLSPSEPVGVKPNTTYKLTGKAMSDSDARFIVKFNNEQAGDAIAINKKFQWIKFEKLLTTQQNQWFLGNIQIVSQTKKLIWLKDISLSEYNSTNGYNFLWESELKTSPLGAYHQTDSALVDLIIKEAEKYGICLQIVLFTRDDYRYMLYDQRSPQYAKAIRHAKNLARYAVARWGYSPNIAVWEYFNEMDPNAPTFRFYQELGNYLQNIDPYRHLRSVSAWGPAPEQWRHPEIDIADLHWYLRPQWSPLWKNEPEAVLNRAQFLLNFATNKPALLGEIGLADDNWAKSNYMEQDKDGIHIHNILWTSAVSGLSGAALFWWWDTFDRLNQYHHFKPLSAFIKNISFNKLPDIKPVRLETSHKNFYAIGLKNKSNAYFWVHNSESTWWNIVVEKKQIEKAQNISVILNDMESGDYSLSIFDTYNGNYISKTKLRCENKKLIIKLPVFEKDIAFKAVRIQD
ncbi:MAG: hypothetical protein ACPMAG_08585 [Limisphaerales bacterium]|jgi:hypothetical protein